MFDTVGKSNVICYWVLSFLIITLKNQKLRSNIIHLMHVTNKKSGPDVTSVMKLPYSVPNTQIIKI